MIRAAIFDMDGVLFDTEKLGQQAMVRISAELGHPITGAFYLKTLGVPNAECKLIYRRARGRIFPTTRRYGASGRISPSTTARIPCPASRG